MIHINQERNDLLKIIAIVTMLIDHIGLVFFPTVYILRIIGRISFPIFAYQIAVGYKNTSSLKNYYIRLLTFSIISQIPYSYFVPNALNVFFTLLLGLTAIYAYDKEKKFISVFLVVLGQALKVSYGAYGVLAILLFFIFFEDKRKITISFSIISIVYILTIGSPLQIFAVLALAFINNHNWNIKIQMNKYIYYGFYPIHITVLLLIKHLIN